MVPPRRHKRLITIFFGDLPNVQRERILILLSPIGGNDDYDSENCWISGVLPSHRRKEKRRSGKRDERPTQDI